MLHHVIYFSVLHGPYSSYGTYLLNINGSTWPSIYNSLIYFTENESLEKKTYKMTQ